MSAMDQVIVDESDSRYVDIENQYGPLKAIEFRTKFNAACVMLTGFEKYIASYMKGHPSSFLATIETVSDSIN